MDLKLSQVETMSHVNVAQVMSSSQVKRSANNVEKTKLSTLTEVLANARKISSAQPNLEI
jgi:hypothetical protein